MGDECSVCHSEIPPLAKTIKALRSGHGALARLAVIEVDSVDTLSDARSFVSSSGITFPVGDDGTAHVMNGVYGFEGDPYAVFIEGSGRIMTIHPGPLRGAGAPTVGEVIAKCPGIRRRRPRSSHRRGSESGHRTSDHEEDVTTVESQANCSRNCHCVSATYVVSHASPESCDGRVTRFGENVTTKVCRGSDCRRNGQTG